MYKLLRRFTNYYQKRGILVTLRRILEQPYRVIFKGHVHLTFADIYEIEDSPIDFPENVSFEFKSSYKEMLEPGMKRIYEHWQKSETINRIKERFELGAIIWIGKKKDDIIGYIWSIQGTMAAAFPIPITPNDAIGFDAEVFEEYRGSGFMAMIIKYMYINLKSMGVTRVYGFVKAWNISSIRGLEKSGQHKFAEVRKLKIFGRNIVIWS